MRVSLYHGIEEMLDTAMATAASSDAAQPRQKGEQSEKPSKGYDASGRDGVVVGASGRFCGVLS